MLIAILIFVAVAIPLLAGAFFLDQASRWRRISNRPHHEMWSSFEREIARAGACGQVCYAWVALGFGWLGLVAMIVKLWGEA